MVVSTRNRSKTSTPLHSSSAKPSPATAQRNSRSTSKRTNVAAGTRKSSHNERTAESESDELAADISAFASSIVTPSKRPPKAVTPASITRPKTRTAHQRTSARASTNASPTTAAGSALQSSNHTATGTPTGTPETSLSRDQSDEALHPAESGDVRASKRRRLDFNDQIVPEAIDTLPISPAPRGTTHPHVDLIKALVQAKLSGAGHNALQGLEDERAKVSDLLQQTVRAGEGNSMLLIGARGTGKTTMVNQLLAELAKNDHEQFHVIRLNGFIHTDDKLALRDIWRQLGREMDVEDQGNARNYADTLATLLAVLSHPAEISSETHPEQVAKSVIFLLEEFDLFVLHPRQTLLYNLFDIAQSRKAPIAVLGLTTRVDVAESLEKRVKSRFSHRYVHLSLPKTLSAFTEICKSTLQLNAEDLSYDQRQLLTQPPGKPKKPKGPTTTKKGATTTPSQTALSAWNTAIDALFDDPKLKHHLAAIYHTTRSIPAAKTSLMLPVSTLTSPTPTVTASSFDLTHLSTTLPPDSKLALLPTLPALALALLIAAARLDIVLNSDQVNFNMAYEEYASQTARSRTAVSGAAGLSGGTGGTGAGGATLGGRVCSREASRGMWERLVELELLVPAGGRMLGVDSLVGAGAGAGAGGFVVVGDSDLLRCDVALEEIPGAVPELDRVLEGWCREI